MSHYPYTMTLAEAAAYTNGHFYLYASASEVFFHSGQEDPNHYTEHHGWVDELHTQEFSEPGHPTARSYATPLVSHSFLSGISTDEYSDLAEEIRDQISSLGAFECDDPDGSATLTGLSEHEDLKTGSIWTYSLHAFVKHFSSKSGQWAETPVDLSSLG